jgi:hypothetical protein
MLTVSGAGRTGALKLEFFLLGQIFERMEAARP